MKAEEGESGGTLLENSSRVTAIRTLTKRRYPRRRCCSCNFRSSDVIYCMPG